MLYTAVSSDPFEIVNPIVIGKHPRTSTLNCPVYRDIQGCEQLEVVSSTPSGPFLAMDPSVDWETTDVLICGCGPTGAMLSGYLGRMGVSNVVLEKEAAITTDPRGIALDDDGIRLMQGLGLYKDMFTKVGSCKAP